MKTYFKIFCYCIEGYLIRNERLFRISKSELDEKDNLNDFLIKLNYLFLIIQGFDVNIHARNYGKYIDLDLQEAVIQCDNHLYHFILNKIEKHPFEMILPLVKEYMEYYTNDWDQETINYITSI